MPFICLNHDSSFRGYVSVAENMANRCSTLSIEYEESKSTLEDNKCLGVEGMSVHWGIGTLRPGIKQYLMQLIRDIGKSKIQ